MFSGANIVSEREAAFAPYRTQFIPTLCTLPASYGTNIPYGSGFINVDSKDRSKIYLRLNSNSQVGLLPIPQKSFGFKALV